MSWITPTADLKNSLFHPSSNHSVHGIRMGIPNPTALSILLRSNGPVLCPNHRLTGWLGWKGPQSPSSFNPRRGLGAPPAQAAQGPIHSLGHLQGWVPTALGSARASPPLHEEFPCSRRARSSLHCGKGGRRAAMGCTTELQCTAS